MEEQRSPEEMQKIAKIATDFARSRTQTEEEMHHLLGSIFEMVKQDNIKLIHIEEVLFTVIVRGTGVIEFHNVNVPVPVEDMAKYIKKLVEKLKSLDVKVAFTYSPEEYYVKAITATKLKWKSKKVRVKEVNKPIKVYILNI
jgi:hypothetical protein